MQNRTLIIAGMHRSGTSLITQWLNKCGLYLGEDFLGAGPGNLDGHYEDMDFLKLHEEILRSNNVRDTGLIEDNAIDVSNYYKNKLKCLINMKNQGHQVWGWKDPRTCLFLETYNELIPDARYLVIIRDYKAVVSSLLSRDFQDYEQKYLRRDLFQRMVWKIFRRQSHLRKYYKARADHYMKVWILYNEEILKYVEMLPYSAYVMLTYAQLKGHAEDVCELLNNRWNLSLNYFDFKKVYKNKLISKHVNADSYVMNKSLVSKAKILQKQLENYMVAI